MSLQLFFVDSDPLAYLIYNDPQKYNEVTTSLNAPFWKEAIQIELDSTLKIHTWELVNLALRTKLHGCKWVVKIKLKTYETIDKLKARLVALGC